MPTALLVVLCLLVVALMVMVLVTPRPATPEDIKALLAESQDATARHVRQRTALVEDALKALAAEVHQAAARLEALEALPPGQTMVVPPEERAIRRLSDEARERFVAELVQAEGVSPEEAQAAWSQIEASIVGEV